MPLIRSCSLSLALLGLLACSAGSQSASDPASAVTGPTLVVLITVDQLRPDYLTRWDNQFTGGFRRLIDGGAFLTNGVQDHAITETAPGHASTLSGRFPYSTGIASNNAGVETDDFPLVGAEGTGAAPFRFKGTTLADWMFAEDARTKVLSVSRKDRGAILPIGRGIHPVFWYAPSSGSFVTSTWYSDTLPEWVRTFNEEAHVEARYAGRQWTLLLDPSEYPEPDSVVAESYGEDFAFPYEIPTDAISAWSAIRGFPEMDELTLEFAWRGVRELGLGGGPQADLLAISLSTTDAVGHRWGPDSREVHDQVLRLDRTLGRFLDSLVALRGADRIAVALTSDHGVAPSPDIRSTWGDNRKARRVSGREFAPILQAIAPQIARAGIDPAAFAFDGQTLAVSREAVAGKARQVLEIARTFAARARWVPGVMRADVIEDLTRADTTSDAIARRWLHMFRPGDDALVAVTLHPYNYFGRGNTATHGSPHDYDAQVPILFWGASFVAGQTGAPIRVVDIAPTLARMLGIAPLERTDGRVVTRVFKPTTP